MSRNHYNNIPKRRAVLLDPRGDLEALGGGNLKTEISLKGTTTMTSGRAVVSGTRITSDSVATVMAGHGGPTGLTFSAHDGYVVISGTGSGPLTYNISI